MRVIKALLATVLFLIPLVPHAGGLSLHFHGFSYHSEGPSDMRRWNERNWGLGVRYHISEELSLQGGRYRNSLHKTSWYAGVNWFPLDLGNGYHAGAFAMLATGYNSPVNGGLALEKRHKNSIITLRGVPPVPDVTPAIIAIEAGVRF